ncbi:MAG TPA: hypothetical protein VHN19_02610 [Burkholderiales bacterium]|nr:hypothetical protein [Burkholderiales bacterium]
MRRAATALAFTFLALFPCASGAAATASGRNWQVTPVELRCEGNNAFLLVDLRLRYLGPKGLVEAPLTRLVDGAGRRFLPQSLVWKSGPRENVKWLVAGGVSALSPGEVGEFAFKFDVRGAGSSLSLEFGDIGAFALTRKDGDGSTCEKLLPASRLHAPPAPAKAARPVKARVYRAAYPCTAQDALRTLEAKFPPYLPRQLLVFGRGFLPDAREVKLPMGSALAQSYAHTGVSDLDSIETAARRALGGFPEYAPHLVAGPADARKKYFLFNWGSEQAPSGNELFSIGVYDLKACPG